MLFTRSDETDLLLPLHEGAHEAQPWATFLLRLRQRVRADEVRLVIGVRGEDDEAVLSTRAGTRGADDRYWRESLRPGRAYTIEEPGGVGQIVRVDEPGGATAWLAIRRIERNFSAADAALLARLAPHLAAALRTRAALDAPEAARRAAEQALDRAGIGWVGFGSGEQVLALSAGAARALGPRWSAANVGAIDTVAAAATPAVRLVRLREAEPRWMVLIPAHAGEPLMARRPLTTIGLILLPRAADREAQIAVLSALFALPPSEARLAAALGVGASLREAADHLGLTIETARNYSKRLFAKTRTRGQVDLVRVIGDSLARLV